MSRFRLPPLLVAGLTAVALATGCSDSASDSKPTTNPSALLGEPNAAKGTPVRVGFIGEGKSAVADLTNEITTARAAANYANDYMGGIAGHPIELVVCESRFDTATSIACANRMVEEKVVAVLGGALADDTSPHRIVTGAGIPWIVASGNSASVLESASLTYALVTSQATNVAAPAAYAEEHGIDSVGAVIIEVPSVIGQWQDVGTPMYDAAGLDLTSKPIAPGTPDMTPQIQSLLGEEPGLVQVVGSPSFCLSAFQALQTLGYVGEITSIPQCFDQSVVESLGASLEGQQIMGAYSVDPTEETYQIYKATVDKYQPDTDLGGAGPTGYQAVLGFARAVQSGGLRGDVTAQSVDAAMKAAKNVELPLGAGIMFSCDQEAIPGLPAVCSGDAVTGVVNDVGEMTDTTILDTRSLFAAME